MRESNMTKTTVYSCVGASALLTLVLVLTHASADRPQPAPGTQDSWTPEGADSRRPETSAQQAPSLSARMPVIASSPATRPLRIAVLGPRELPIQGATIVCDNRDAPLGYTDEQGLLIVGRDIPLGTYLQASAPGFATDRIPVTEQIEEFHFRLFPDVQVDLFLVDEQGTPLPGLQVTLSPSASAALEGGQSRTALSDHNGSAHLDRLVPGTYHIAVKADGLALAMLEGPGHVIAPVIRAPCVPATLTLQVPSVVWLEPELGTIVSGYFAIPFTNFSMTPAVHRTLQEIQGGLERQKPRSRAAAFLGRADPKGIAFRGFLERGGWVEVTVPAVRWSSGVTPTVFANKDRTVEAMAGILVEALAHDGGLMDEIPFCLQQVSSDFGVFSYPFAPSSPLQLPPGTYAFAETQVGVSALFERPAEVTAEAGSASHPRFARVEARGPVGKVSVHAKYLVGQNPKSLLGVVGVRSSSGFQTTYEATGEPVRIWLPMHEELSFWSHQLVNGKPTALSNSTRVDNDDLEVLLR